MLRSTDICPESCWLVRSLVNFGGGSLDPSRFAAARCLRRLRRELVSLIFLERSRSGVEVFAKRQRGGSSASGKGWEARASEHKEISPETKGVALGRLDE